VKILDTPVAFSHQGALAVMLRWLNWVGLEIIETPTPTPICWNISEHDYLFDGV
jgi:hypothetical protein